MSTRPVRERAVLLALWVAVPCLLAAAGFSPRPSGEEKPELRVVFAVGDGKGALEEYRKHLESRYRVSCRWLEAPKASKRRGSDAFEATPFRGIDALETCDVIVTNLYRTWAPPEELKALQEQFRSKGVVGLRRAHHGFQNWLDVDREVFGVDYEGHYYGPNVTLRVPEGAKDSPFVAGLKPFLPEGGLYQHVNVEDDVVPYLVGGPEGKPPHPQTWSREVRERKQRVFYTRYDPRDLEKDDGVRSLVTRAIFWAAGKSPDQYAREETPAR